MKLCITIILVAAAVMSAQTPAASPAKPAAPTAQPADPNEVVLTIGDRKITAAQYEALVKVLLPAQLQQSALGPGRRQFAQRLVEMSVLASQASTLNLEKQPSIAAMIAFQRENLLASAMFTQLVQQAVVPDADVQAYYDSHKTDFETLTGRHILIRVKGAPMAAVSGRPELSDAEARAKAESIRSRIVAGEDFAKIAKEESDDTATATKGGDLGEFKHGTMVPPFEQAAFALKVGDISEPVKTPFGYHIIQIESHSVKSLAEVKDSILAQLKPVVARKTVDGLMNQTKFDISDSFFGPPPTAVAHAAPAK